MKTLYLSDLDGTLLNSHTELSNKSRNVINSLIARGMLFSIATARSLSSVKSLLGGLNLKLPVILANGVFLQEYESDKILFSDLFKRNTLQTFRDFFSFYGAYPFVYTMLDGEQKVLWIPEYETPAMTYYLSERKGDIRFQAVYNLDHLFAGEPYYYACMDDRDKLLPLYEAIRQNPNLCGCHFQQELYRNEYWLELMPPNASKSNTILKLKEIVPYEKLVVFGDSINDLTMFELSDECYAPSNAIPEIKARATGILASCDDDAVAQWLFDHADI